MWKALGRTPYTAPAVGGGVLDQRVTADFGGLHLLCRLWPGGQSAAQSGPVALQAIAIAGKSPAPRLCYSDPQDGRSRVAIEAVRRGQVPLFSGPFQAENHPTSQLPDRSRIEAIEPVPLRSTPYTVEPWVVATR